MRKVTKCRLCHNPVVTMGLCSPHYQKLKYWRNPELARAKATARRKKYKEQANERAKKYYQAHKEERSKYDQARRFLKPVKRVKSIEEQRQDRIKRQEKIDNDPIFKRKHQLKTYLYKELHYKKLPRGDKIKEWTLELNSYERRT